MPRPSSTFLWLALLYGCASPGIPPGGPTDTDGPKVVGTAPDSGATGVSPRDVVFSFDEIVNELPAGAPTLEGLFVISPREGTPSVDWHRREISVRPRKGWRSNVTYTVSMLPGITDLRGNIRNTGATIVFSTGPSLANGAILGRLFNWVAGVPAPKGFVEARNPADTSLAYVAVADSTGAFALTNLAPGTYLVRGVIDDNGNRGLDRREAWDTTTIAVTETTRRDLLAFVRDSVRTTLANVVLRDSVTLELLLDSPVDPAQNLTSANVTVTAADSTRIPIASVVRSPVDTAGSTGFRPPRPPPARSILVKLGFPLRATRDFRVRTIEIRSLEGRPTTSERVVTLGPVPIPTTPVPPPPPPTAPIRR
jgi:Big-like domain-containing protein